MNAPEARQPDPLRPLAPQADGSASTPPHPALRLGAVVLLALLAGYLLVLFLWPFLPAIVTSAVVAVLVYPAHRRLLGWIGQPTVAALVSTVAAFVLVLLPTVLLGLVLVSHFPARVEFIVRDAAGLVAPSGAVARFVLELGARAGVEPEAFSAALVGQLEQIAGTLGERTLGLLSGIGGALLQAGAALFTLYYLLRDGRGIVASVKWLLPLEPEASDALLERSRDVVHATIFGNLAVAVIQGVVGGLVFWLLGVPGAVLWGTTMSFLGLLPVIGPPVVWLPAAGALLLAGEVGRGLLLLALGTFVISGIDNVLRPLLMSGRTQLHPLVAFFSVLGGIVVFGAVGIFVGPVVFVAALTLVELARVAMDPVAMIRRDSGLLLQPAPPPYRWPGTDPAAQAAPGQAPLRE